MFKHSRAAVIGGVALGWLVSLAGCTSSKGLPPVAPGPRFDNGYTSWAPDGATKEAVAGIDFGMIEWGLWNDDLVFAVWLDRAGGVNKAGGNVGSFGRSVSPGKAEGGGWQVLYQVRAEAPQVHVECKSTDGKGGSLIVNGRSPYELSAGRLFLISAEGGKVRVKQLSREGLTGKPGALSESPECYVKLRADSDVKAFFAKSADKPEK